MVPRRVLANYPGAAEVPKVPATDVEGDVSAKVPAAKLSASAGGAAEALAAVAGAVSGLFGAAPAAAEAETEVSEDPGGWRVSSCNRLTPVVLGR